jgi:hypothetical protein
MFSGVRRTVGARTARSPIQYDPPSPANLGVLAIHGIGEQGKEFADNLFRGLTKQLGGRAGEVAFESCWWAPLLQKCQDRVWNKMESSGMPMDYCKVRRLVEPTWVILCVPLRIPAQLHRRIHAGTRVRTFDAFQAAVPHGEPGRASDGFWPTRWGALSSATTCGTSRAPTAFPPPVPWRDLETMVSFVTYGSTIPLFLPPVEKVECIRFPSPKLLPEYRAVSARDNVYDRDDLLGYPIATVWDEMHGTVITDMEVDAGPWPLSITPLSHIGYDVDKDFLGLVHERMVGILDVAALHPAGRLNPLSPERVETRPRCCVSTGGESLRTCADVSP